MKEEVICGESLYFLSHLSPEFRTIKDSDTLNMTSKEITAFRLELRDWLLGGENHKWEVKRDLQTGNLELMRG